MSDKNDVVMIELDRPRELRFGHKALKTLVAITGKDLDSLMENENAGLEDVEKFMYCGLLSDARTHGETLTLEAMEDLLDAAPSFSYITEKMTEAIQKAFPSVEVGADPGNVGAQPKKQSRSTGSNR